MFVPLGNGGVVAVIPKLVARAARAGWSSCGLRVWVRMSKALRNSVELAAWLPPGTHTSMTWATDWSLLRTTPSRPTSSDR